MIGKFARFAARTFFREIVLEGTQQLPENGPVIFTPNHPNGLLDPMLMFFLSPPFRLRFVAKATLFRIPIFGSVLRSIGAIPVIRKFEADGEVDYSAFFGACLDALAQGDSIVIFPEGRSLPQSYLAPLKTGPARLFLMAQQKGIPAKIVPIGLNYERGTTFRSRVLVCIAPPIQIWRAGTPALQVEASDPGVEASIAIRQLTETLTDSLEAHVVQAESYRERELLSLLAVLSAGEDSSQSDFKRFSRLKEFERGLSRLRHSAAKEIDSLRKLLSRYERLARDYKIDPDQRSSSQSNLLLAILGAFLAIPGWILNFIPYQLCDLFIQMTRKDAADTATFKVVYALFLFPLCYFLEGYLFYRYLGSFAAILFFILILPLSYFTLFYSEWYESHFAGTFWPKSRDRMKSQLDRLRKRILERLEEVRKL